MSNISKVYPPFKITFDNINYEFNRIGNICYVIIEQFEMSEPVNISTKVTQLPDYLIPARLIYILGDAEMGNCFVEASISSDGFLAYKRRNQGQYSFGSTAYIV